MKRTVIVVLACLAMVSCSKGRIIPDSVLADIYYEMFLADRWLDFNPSARTKADTSFFYEPIFRAHGYSFKDYDATVQNKLRKCEKFSEFLSGVSNRLVSEADTLAAIKRRSEDARFRNSLIRGYEYKEFKYPYDADSEYVDYYEILKFNQYEFAGKI